jgi:hypothetical protein
MKNDLSDLAAFAVVAGERSFTRVGKHRSQAAN